MTTETFHQSRQGCYELTRVHHVDGNVLRVRVHRGSHGFQSPAVAEVFTPQCSWTVVASIPWAEWHKATPLYPADATPLAPIADRLVERARRILTHLRRPPEGYSSSPPRRAPAG